MSNKYLKNLVQFAVKHPLTWHSYAGDKETVNAVCAGVNLGLLEVNDSNQFSLKSPTKAEQFLTEN